MSILVGAFSIAGPGVTFTCYDELWQGIATAAWPVVGMAVFAGLATTLMLFNRRYWFATILAALAVTLVLLGWVIGQIQSEYLFGLQAVAANTRTDNVRWLLAGCMIVGILLITPPMIWLFYIFKKEVGENEKLPDRKKSTDRDQAG